MHTPPPSTDSRPPSTAGEAAPRTAEGATERAADRGAERAVDRAPEGVRESEARLRATFDLAPVGLAHVGIGGEFLRVNRRLCELLGRPEAALLALRWQDVAHADDRASGLDQLLRLLAGERDAFTIEQRCVGGDGAARWLRLSASLVREPSPDGFPGRPRWAVLVADEAAGAGDGAPPDARAAADERAARAAAEREARRLATVNEAAALLASTLDLATVLDRLAALMLDPLGEVVQLFLVEGGEVRHTLGAARDPSRAAALDALARHAPRADGPTPVATVVRTRQPLLLARVGDALLRTLCDDAPHHALQRAVGLRSMLALPMIVRETVVGAVCVGRTAGAEPFTHEDLAFAEQLVRHAALAVENARAYASEQRALADAQAARHEAERQRLAAERASVAKSRFLATMSHELRTPLNAIAGHVQLVELGVHGPLTGAQAHALDRAQKAQRHLTGLINDVLNYARLEAGGVQFALARVDVAAEAAGAAAALEPQAEARRVLLDLERPAGPRVAWADAEKLRQVLLHVLSNALKFTPAGGHVTVDLPARADGADAAHVYVRVRDTGVGIPDGQLAEVFLPFVQVHSAGNPLTREQEGTGLGLAIARDLARGMGGDLRARHAAGRGAAFTLTLRAWGG